MFGPIGKHDSDALVPCGLVDKGVMHVVLSAVADTVGWKTY